MGVTMTKKLFLALTLLVSTQANAMFSRVAVAVQRAVPVAERVVTQPAAIAHCHKKAELSEEEMEKRFKIARDWQRAERDYKEKNKHEIKMRETAAYFRTRKAISASRKSLDERIEKAKAEAEQSFKPREDKEAVAFGIGCTFFAVCPIITAIVGYWSL